MPSRLTPLVAPRRYKIGTRRPLTVEDCLKHGVRVLEPQLRVLRTYVPAPSYPTYEYLVRTLLLWVYDIPGSQAPWDALQHTISRATDVLTACSSRPVPDLGGRNSGGARYAYAERLPAALLTCLTIDALADLACSTATVTDSLTAYEQGWGIWDGAFLRALVAWQADGRLPQYTVTSTTTRVEAADRVLLASQILPPSLWSFLGKDLLRLVSQYIVAPTLSILSRYCERDAQPDPYIDALLTACLTGRLRVNRLPGQVFILPTGTFLAIPRALEPLQALDALSPEDLVVKLRALNVIQPQLFTLTIPADPTGKAVMLHGVIMPHHVLQTHCQRHPRYHGLPWATPSLAMYTAATHTITPAASMGPVYANS